MAAESRSLVYGGRFALAYVALGAAVTAAIMGLVVAVAGIGGSGRAAAWSTWHPTGGGLGLAEQIAAHVGKEYRLPGGTQMDAVIAKPPEVSASNQTIPVGYVGIRASKKSADSVAIVSNSNAVLYTLCGLGPSCTIATGTPSTERGRLVQREILELALYTFHYNSAIHNVIAFMPPRAANAASVVIFLQRADLSAELSKPLAATLNPRTPGVTTMTPEDAARVYALTGRRAYSYTLTRAQDGNAILILSHLRA